MTFFHKQSVSNLLICLSLTPSFNPSLPRSLIHSLPPSLPLLPPSLTHSLNHSLTPLPPQLTALVTSFYLKLSEHFCYTPFLHQIREIGFLAQFESLLSTYGEYYTFFLHH